MARLILHQPFTRKKSKKAKKAKIAKTCCVCVQKKIEIETKGKRRGKKYNKKNRQQKTHFVAFWA
jgi:hypothetical protein